MTNEEKSNELHKVEKYLETCKTKEEVDRAVAMLLEIQQKYVDYLTELIERVSPDYIPMEL